MRSHAEIKTATDLFQNMDDYTIYPAYGTWFTTSGSYTYIILGVFITGADDEFTIIGRKVGAGLDTTTTREPIGSIKSINDHVIF